jgi:hypothetical protein
MDSAAGIRHAIPEKKFDLELRNPFIPEFLSSKFKLRC